MTNFLRLEFKFLKSLDDQMQAPTWVKNQDPQKADFTNAYTSSYSYNVWNDQKAWLGVYRKWLQS